MEFEGHVEDYNMGTLLRLNAQEDITEKNTMLGKLVAYSVFLCSE